MTFFPVHRRLQTKASLLIATALLGASGALLWHMARSVHDMQTVGLPAALALPAIEKRAVLLKEQQEVVELQALLRGGGTDEFIHEYVLPEGEDIDRLLATFDVLFAHFQARKDLTRISAIDVGEPIERGSGSIVLPLSFSATFTKDALRTFTSIIDASGMLTVRDALRAQDIDRLLVLTEQEDPDTIAAIERFLSLDILRYSADPAAYQEQVRRAFSENAVPVLLDIFDAPILRRTADVLQPIAHLLEQQKLWPLRMLQVESMDMHDGRDGTVEASFVIHAFHRSGSSM